MGKLFRFNPTVDIRAVFPSPPVSPHTSVNITVQLPTPSTEVHLGIFIYFLAFKEFLVRSRPVPACSFMQEIQLE